MKSVAYDRTLQKVGNIDNPKRHGAWPKFEAFQVMCDKH